MRILLLINLIIILFFFFNTFSKVNNCLFSLIDKIHDKIISSTSLRQHKKINEILSRLANMVIKTDENIEKIKKLKKYVVIVMSLLKVLLLLILFNFTGKTMFGFAVIVFLTILFIYTLLLEIDWYLYSQVKSAFDLLDVYIVNDNVLIKIAEEHYMSTNPIEKKYETKEKVTGNNKTVKNRLYWFSLLRWKYTTVYIDLRKANNIINLFLSIITFIIFLFV